MENQAYRQFVTKVWPALFLTIILLTGCSPAETPPTAGPIVTELTPPPAALAEATATAFTPSTSPLSTPEPHRTSLPVPTNAAASPTPTVTPSPDSFNREGDTLSSISPPASSTPGAPSAIFIIPCVVGPDALQLRSGPDPGYDLIKILPAGTALSALKYHNANGLWLLVETRQYEAGWVNAAAVSCRGVLSRLPMAEGINPPSPTTSPTAASPTPTAAPTWTSTPAAGPALPAPSLASWRGEYYSNPNLTGEPVLVRDDPALDFNWVADSPAPELPADNFSVRWTRPFEFTEEGDYRFWADVDDGVKLYLNGWLIIDEWNTNPYVLHSGVFADIKPGVHTLVVEYFEAAGDAHIRVWFEKTIVSGDKWVGEYYNNPDFRGPPFLVREDDDIDFDWGDDEPVSGMPDDNFSVRWQRTVVLQAGDYNFEAQLAEEDRVKIYLDDWLILEEDSERGGTVRSSFKDVGTGIHTLRVEYQDYSDEASIEVDWDRDD